VLLPRQPRFAGRGPLLTGGAARGTWRSRQTVVIAPRDRRASRAVGL